MKSTVAELAFADLPTPLPLGAIQFFDGFYPSLLSGTYKINLQQTLTPGGSVNPPSFAAVSQSFTVEAPEFFIDSSEIESCYPPPGAAGIYDSVIPFVVLKNPALPWERDLVPNAAIPTGPANPAPWIALLTLAESEILLPPDSHNSSVSKTASDFLASSQTVLKPTLPAGWVSSTTLNAQCQTITITGKAFNAVTPGQDELKKLAHCRAINTGAEGKELLAVIMANRFSVTANAAPQKYYAHLVSLEGYAGYLGTTPEKSIPTKHGSSDLMDVELVSLYSWTFTSLAEKVVEFETLIKGLVNSESTTSALQLPVSESASLKPSIKSRLQNGYVPLSYSTNSGDESFAWYRGPFSPVVPVALPETGAQPEAVNHAATADELMIYLAEQGIFDLSYSTAWNLGRQLALADAQFVEAINATWSGASQSLAQAAQKMSLPHLAGEQNVESFFKTDTSRRAFTSHVKAGLGEKWTEQLAQVRQGEVSNAQYARPRSRRRCRGIAPVSMLDLPGAAEALTNSLPASAELVSQWLARLSLLEMVPFTHLVPNADMLPTESIRFFYVDSNWIDAAIAGATSIAIKSSADKKLGKTLHSHFVQVIRREHRQRAQQYGPVATPAPAANDIKLTGVLIRSELVSAWPHLLVQPKLGDELTPIVRNDVLSPSVRLVLFQGIPDAVELAEPYHGLLFGQETGQGVIPRNATVKRHLGAQIHGAENVVPTIRSPAAGALGGVLDITTTSTALQRAAGVESFSDSADVYWNNQKLATSFVDSNELKATVPADLITADGTADITVKMGGVISSSLPFIIEPALALNGIFPQRAVAGSSEVLLSISGVGFDSSSVVNVKTKASTKPLTGKKVISSEEIQVVLPATLLSVPCDLTITVENSPHSTNGLPFTVTATEALLESISPNAVPVAGVTFELIVNGEGFTDKAVVTWNTQALPTKFVNESQLIATVDSSLLSTAATVPITIALTGVATNAISLTVTSAPEIALLKPSVFKEGTAESTLTIEGVNFGNSPVVRAGTIPLSVIKSTPQQIQVTVPETSLGTACSLEITVDNGQSTSPSMPVVVLGTQPGLGAVVPDRAVAGDNTLTLTVYGGFGSGDFAIQMVKAPQSQTFIGTD